MSLLSILLASLLGSVHCAAMCGAFAALASDRQPRLGLGVVAYNTGRLTTYAVIGAIAGLLGRGLDTVGGVAGIARTSALLLGCVLVGYGLFRLIAGERDTALSRFFHKRMGRWYARLASKLPAERPLMRAYGIGLLSTILPCGWLYGFAAVAATTADPLAGVFAMFVFWVGTLPMMISLGTVARELLRRWGAQVPAISSALLVAAGAFSIALHFEHSGHHHPAVQVEKIKVP